MTALSDLPVLDRESGDTTVVIETPRGSRNKYKYDKACRSFRLGGVLPEGMSFPYDFGFIPSTLGADGDPVDVLVLLDAPVMPGCVLTARLIGVIEANQRERGAKRGEWIRNDRLIAVATHTHRHQDIRTIGDLRPHLLDEIQEFFVDYNRMSGKKFKPLSHHGPERARKLIARGAARLRKKAGASRA